MQRPASILRGLNCAVIVAHPDDETLWAGGTVLMHPDTRWTIVTTCRRDDPDRSVKFHSVLTRLHAVGAMGDLDDGPEQMPLAPQQVEAMILSLLPETRYDLIITHSPQGEYTRHRRHEEVAEAVLGLLADGRLGTNELWLFAYEDGGRAYLPRPIRQADRIAALPADIYAAKHQLITETYGFAAGSWEAQATPRTESFWTFQSADGVKTHIRERSATR